MSDTASTRLEALRRKKAQIDAQIRAIAARETVARRRLDTRRKIIVGSIVLAMIEEARRTGDQPIHLARSIASRIASLPRPGDRELLADLTTPDSAPKAGAPQ